MKLESEQRRHLISPSLVLDEIPFQSENCIVDIGAGRGYFTHPAAKLVGKSGRVCAVDISERMLTIL